MQASNSQKEAIKNSVWYLESHSFYTYSVIHVLYIYIGVQVVSPDGVTHNSRAMLLLSSCDLPAKALVSNMKAYNGKYGCATCKDMGAGSSNPLHRIWPFCEVIVIRTKQECYKSICEAVEKKEAVSFNCSYKMVR